MNRVIVCKRWVSVCLLFVGLAVCSNWTVASTTTNLIPGQSILLSSVLQASGENIQIGDKLFDNFQFSYIDTDAIAANNLHASDVVVTALQDQFGYGFSMEMPLTTASNVTKDVVVKFSVLVLDPSKQIADVHLDMTGSAHGMGLADVGESVYTNGFGVGTIAHLDVSAPGVLSNSVTFATPQTIIYVEKDILVSSGNCNLINDNATICKIEQSFSQIPEPSTWLLVGLGLLAILKCHSIGRRSALRPQQVAAVPTAKRHVSWR